jgi:hypothetical protein
MIFCFLHFPTVVPGAKVLRRPHCVHATASPPGRTTRGQKRPKILIFVEQHHYAAQLPVEKRFIRICC